MLIHLHVDAIRQPYKLKAQSGKLNLSLQGNFLAKTSWDTELLKQPVFDRAMQD